METRSVLRAEVIIKNFSPAWFASVMGTGILAITSYAYSSYFKFLRDVAYILFYFNIIWCFILLVPWLLRWILFSNDAMDDLKHPINTQFYPTVAVGFIVIALGFIVIQQNIAVAKVFWFIGAIVTIFYAILIPLIIFEGRHTQLDHINPAWFIPPVALIVVPVAGALLIPSFQGWSKELVIVLDYFGWGAGFFLWISLLAITLYRFILHHPLPNTLIPTMWINLGPIGVGISSLFNLVNNSPFITAKEPFLILGLLIWGFGIWWVLMALVTTIIYIWRLNLPFAMSWWAFTFPLGAYVSATHILGTKLAIPLIDHIGFYLYCLLALFWTATFLNTLRGIVAGKLFFR